MKTFDALILAAQALDAMQPGQKGYIDYKNKPGYNWKTINHSKVLLNGKGRVVAGATGKFKGRTWGAKWKGLGTKRAYTKRTAAPAAANKSAGSPLAQAAQAAPAPSKPKYTAYGISAAQLKANQMANQGNSYNARAVGHNLDVLMNRGDSFEDAVAKIEALFDSPSAWGYRFDRQKAEQYLQELKDIAAGKTAATGLGGSAAAPAPATTTSKGHKMANGKNLVASSNLPNIRYGKSSDAKNFETVSMSQGFRGKPRLVDKAEFDKACKASGVYGVRSYGGTKQQLVDRRKQLYGQTGDNDWYTDCGGGSCYGMGMYVAIARNSAPGKAANSTDMNYAYRDSSRYASSASRNQESITMDASAKVIRGHYSDIDGKIRREWKQAYISSHPGATMSDANDALYDHSFDIGVLAAELGYDAIVAEDAGFNCDYLNVLNRTKCIILEGGYQP